MDVVVDTLDDEYSETDEDESGKITSGWMSLRSIGSQRSLVLKQLEKLGNKHLEVD